ncbi:MAG TPA: STAS domain-containing protein [Jatrophihabitans sp.]|jgi:anti-sigma B factor antagonist|nr:STAS domain-containing protein [Jatrophihabitans sp.]
MAHDDWRAAIALRGELDVANMQDLRVELTDHLDAGRRVIRVDVGDLEFMDSTALGELVTASQRCTSERGSLILTNVPGRMRRLITLADLDHVLLVDTANDNATNATG